MPAMPDINYIIEIYTDEDTLAATVEASGPVVPSEDELITWPAAASPSLTDAVVAYVNHRINGLGRSVPHVAVLVRTELVGVDLLAALGLTFQPSN